MLNDILYIVIGVIGIVVNVWLLSQDDSRSPHAIGPKVYMGAFIASLFALSRGIMGLLGIPMAGP